MANTPNMPNMPNGPTDNMPVSNIAVTMSKAAPNEGMNPMPMHADMPGLMFDHSRLSLAMAYVLMQPPITKVYRPEDALKQGTLFPELDKPFMGHMGVRA